MSRAITGNDVRADFFLTLAGAFAPPVEESMQKAFLELLPEDLAEMSGELGYPVADAIAELENSLRALTAPLELLKLYAGLFLTPPAPVHLSSAIYLDGSLRGGSEYEMRQWFARHGLSASAVSGRSADHVENNLHFAAALFGRAQASINNGDAMDGLALAAEARRFLAAYPRRWLAPMRTACARACAERGLPTTYVHLLEILAGALESEIVHDAARSPEAALAPHYPTGSSRGVGAPTAEDLAEIAFRLRASGLSIDHVRARPQWREDVFRRRLTEGPLDGSIASRVQG